MGDYVSSNKIKENKYKILRMSILLGNDEDREETLNNFEDAAREIDAMNDEIYLKDLALKFYDTTNLEDEEKKLAALVDYIGGRVEQRISLLTDFSNVTGFDLTNLPPIQYYDKLDEYKERLDYIREYLNNVKRLGELNQEVDDVTDKLDKAYKNKASCEEFNLRNEDILLNKFLKVVSGLDYFKDINENNVEERLNEVSLVVEDSKKSLDIFTKSFTTLINSGISGDEEKEYRSYVVNAQDVYYANKEKEYLFRLYQYLIRKESEYDAILVKRDCISNLLYERLNLRKEFNINDNDLLSVLYDILDRQYEDIKHQGENIDSIDRFNEVLLHKREEINQLELDNQKVEILAILREFGIIDTYSDESLDETNVIDSNYVEVPVSFDGPIEESVKPIEDNVEVAEENNEPVEDKLSFSFDAPIVEENASSGETIDESVSSGDVVEETVSSGEVVEETSAKDDDAVSSNLNDVADFTPEVNTEPIQDVVKDNQVVSISDASSIDLDLVRSKANKVMQRVGDMLGIKISDEKVVSVTEEKPIEEKVAVENNNPLFSDDGVIDNNISDSNDDFWFPSDTPDALNELPDLEVSPDKNIGNDLNFPELKADFGDKEVSS